MQRPCNGHCFAIETGNHEEHYFLHTMELFTWNAAFKVLVLLSKSVKDFYRCDQRNSTCYAHVELLAMAVTMHASIAVCMLQTFAAVIKQCLSSGLKAGIAELLQQMAFCSAFTCTKTLDPGTRA